MLNNDKNIKDIINSRLSRISVSQQLKDKILTQNHNAKKIKRRSLRIVFAVCLCVMTSIPIMAATIPGYEKLLDVVGTQASRYLQPVKMVSESNGIKMEVVAAMNDDETAVVYLTMQDLVGNRIDETIRLCNVYMEGADILTHGLIDYDENTKTATFSMDAYGGHKLNGKKVTVRVDSFLSGEENFHNVDAEISLKELDLPPPKTFLLQMENVSSGESGLYDEVQEKGEISCLIPEEKNIVLQKIDFVNISNIGFVNGKLHVQTKWKESIHNNGSLHLKNKNGDLIRASFLDFSVENKSAKYIEYVFDVEASNISDYSLFGDFQKYNEIEGEWNTTFKIKAIDESKKVASNVIINNWKIDNISITSVGINIIGNEADSPRDIRINVTMKDGAILSYNKALKHVENEKETLKFLTDPSIEVDNIKSVSINSSNVDFD